MIKCQLGRFIFNFKASNLQDDSLPPIDQICFKGLRRGQRRGPAVPVHKGQHVPGWLLLRHERAGLLHQCGDRMETGVRQHGPTAHRHRRLHPGPAAGWPRRWRRIRQARQATRPCLLPLCSGHHGHRIALRTGQFNRFFNKSALFWQTYLSRI